MLVLNNFSVPLCRQPVTIISTPHDVIINFCDCLPSLLLIIDFLRIIVIVAL